MNKFLVLDSNIDNRVDLAVKEALKTYINKLSFGLFIDGLEASFQCYLFNLIQQELEKIKTKPKEIFTVVPEFNIPLNGRHDEIDLLINYSFGKKNKKWLIELKYKKESQSAHDVGVIQSFEDIKDLESHKLNDKTFSNNYFIFLTDCKTYVTFPRKGTRTELPMYDGAYIKANSLYIPTGAAAIECVKKTHYPNGFKFFNSYQIVFNKVESKHGKTYYFFYLKI